MVAGGMLDDGLQDAPAIVDKRGPTNQTVVIMWSQGYGKVSRQ